MLPHVQVEASGDRRKMVEDVARNLYPGKKSIGDLTPAERARWIPLAIGLLHDDPDVSQQAETAGKVISEAEVALSEKRAATAEEERKKREARDQATHLANLAHQAQVAAHQERVREIEEQRWQVQTEAWKQRNDQEKTREANGSRIERSLMGMMIVAFAVGIGLIAAAAVTRLGNPDAAPFTGGAFVVGGSGVTGVLSLVMLALMRIRRSRSELELMPEPAPPPPLMPVEEAPSEAPA